MDPYEDITRQCQTSSSQEQHLRGLIISISHHEQDDNRLCICSNEEEDEEEETHHSLSPPTPIMICSAPDTLSEEEEQTQEPSTHVRLNSPKNGASFKHRNNTQESEPTKTKPLQRENDPGLWESTPTSCSTFRGKSCSEVDVECLKSSAEKACVRDQREVENSPKDVQFSKEKKEGSFSKFDAVGGENDENPKKSKVGSSVEFEICEKLNNDGNAVSVSQVFERLIESLSVEGNVDKRSSSLIKSQQIASENAAVSRKLPYTIRKQSKEKGVISGNPGGSRKLPSSTQNQSKKEGHEEALEMLAKVAIASGERETSGYVDILEAAKQAGYTFPRPRWWQSGDEF